MSDCILVIGAHDDPPAEGKIKKTGPNPGGTDTARVLLRHFDFTEMDTLTVFFCVNNLVLQFEKDLDAKPRFAEIADPDSGLLKIVLNYIGIGIGGIAAPTSVNCVHIASHADFNGIYAEADYRGSLVTDLNDYYDLSTSPPTPNARLKTIRGKGAPGFYVKLWGCNVFPLEEPEVGTIGQREIQKKLREALPENSLKPGSPMYSAVDEYRKDIGFNTTFADTLLDCSYKARGSEPGKEYFLRQTAFPVALSEALQAPVVASLIGNTSNSVEYKDGAKDYKGWASVNKQEFHLFEVKPVTGDFIEDFRSTVIENGLTISDKNSEVVFEENYEKETLKMTRDPLHRRIMGARFNKNPPTVYFEPGNNLVGSGNELKLLQPRNTSQMRGIADVFEENGILVREKEYFKKNGKGKSFFTKKAGYPGSGYFVYDWNEIRYKTIAGLSSVPEPQTTEKKVLAKAELLDSNRFTDTSGFLNRRDYLA